MLYVCLWRLHVISINGNWYDITVLHICICVYKHTYIHSLCECKPRFMDINCKKMDHRQANWYWIFQYIQQHIIYIENNDNNLWCSSYTRMGIEYVHVTWYSPLQSSNEVGLKQIINRNHKSFLSKPTYTISTCPTELSYV